MKASRPVVVISGGAAGIGYSLARLLAPSHQLVLISRTQTKLDAAAQFLRNELGATVKTERADVTNRNAVEQAIKLTFEELGRIDWVIAAAGMSRPLFFDESHYEDHATAMNTNYFGTLNMILASLPYLKEQRGGRLVLFSSACVFNPLLGYSAYTPSKSAILALAKTLAVELSEFDITVHVTCPPDTDTEQYREELQIRPAITSKFAQLTGLWSPDDVAHAILQGIKANREIIIPAYLSRLDALFGALIWPAFKRRQIQLHKRFGRRY